ncbi:MAG: hydrogenase maturation protease [Candidatus Saccharicenans sp.]
MPEKWVSFLKKELRGLERLLVLGTGNALKADDAAGLLVASLLDRNLSRRQKARIKTLRVYELLESYHRRIRRLQPSHLIIIDAVDMGRRPGSIMATRLEPGQKKKKVGGEFYLLLEKLAAESSCRIYLVGIQPDSLDFGHPITPLVKEACRQVAESLIQLATGAGR